jgi:hypothetical protein
MGLKYIEMSIFKGVYKYEVIKTSSGHSTAGIKYIAKYHGWTSKLFENELDAARSYDLKLIDLGLEPINILKRK